VHDGARQVADAYLVDYLATVMPLRLLVPLGHSV
jgi:hypothetical protein